MILNLIYCTDTMPDTYFVKQYASKNGKIDIKINGKIIKRFFEDWKVFCPKSIEIYHILCTLRVYYNVVQIFAEKLKNIFLGVLTV